MSAVKGKDGILPYMDMVFSHEIEKLLVIQFVENVLILQLQLKFNTF